MRTIKVPNPVELVHDKTARLCTFGDFLGDITWTDKRWRDEWAKSFESLAGLRIPLIPDTSVSITDGDWEKLNDTAKNANIAPQFSTALMPFFHAITQAKMEDPNHG